jgi:hypothetical protein
MFIFRRSKLYFYSVWKIKEQATRLTPLFEHDDDDDDDGIVTVRPIEDTRCCKNTILTS